MKIKKLFKKTLAGTMLAIMACASMNAMAEREWYKIDDTIKYIVDFKNKDKGTYTAKSWDEICDNYAKLYYERGVTCTADGWNCPESATPGHMIYSANVAGTLYCKGNTPGGEIGFPVGTYCEKGRIRPEGEANLGYFGCWEYVDCENPNVAPEDRPEVCKEPEKDPCDPGLYRSARDIPPECKTTCPPKHPLKDGFGLVACNEFNDDVEVCDYPNNFLSTDKGRDIFKNCVREHEQMHINNKTCFGSVCRDGMISPKEKEFDSYDYLDEMIAYAVEIKCLERERPKCVDSKNPYLCENDVKRAIHEAKTMQSKNAKGYCSEPGVDCSKDSELECRDPSLKPETEYRKGKK